MNKIERISSFFLKVFNILIILIPLYLVTQWFFFGTEATKLSNFLNYFGSLEKSIDIADDYINLNSLPWTWGLKVLGFFTDFIGVLPFFISLFFLKKLFTNYSKGNVFSSENAGIYRKIGYLYLIDALFIKSLSDTLLTLVVSYANPAGPKLIAISFGIPNLYSLFYSILVIVVSWVMLEASKMHEENKFTI